MKLFFLEAAVPLVKSFTLLEDGTYQKDAYPLVKNFTSHEVQVTTPQHLFNALVQHSAHGHCLLKGKLKHALTREPRAGTTNALDKTSLFVVDADGIPADHLDVAGGVDGVDKFVRNLLPEPFRDVSYVFQYSASQNITTQENEYRIHALFLLKEAVSPEDIKLWALEYNLTQPMLAPALRLTRLKNTLTFGLDITVNQNDKLIYIAPPNCKNFENPLPERIHLVTKRKNAVDFSFPHSNKAVIDEAKRKAVNELRKKEGLRARRALPEKVIRGVTVEVPLGEAEITGIKEERGFVYFNFNGGDSWGYYHPVEDASIIYNFKGEPNYSTRELLPAYYAEARERAKAEQSALLEQAQQQRIDKNNEEGFEYYAVYLVNAGIYAGFAYDHARDFLDLKLYKNLQSVRNFQRLHGLDMDEPFEEWEIRHTPFSEGSKLDFDAQVVNTFQHSDLYMNAHRKVSNDLYKAPERIPPTIFKVISHACGEAPHAETEDSVMERFINHLAYIFQTQRKTGIAWIFQGTFGTGKGVMWSRIISPLFGEKNCNRSSFYSLVDEKFNGNIQRSLCLLIDEADTEELTKKKKLDQTLKELITEPHITLREMYQTARQEDSFCNLFIFSNEIHSVSVKANDRRFSICPRQETSIKLSTEEVEGIEHELPIFAEYLMAYEYDLKKARTPLENQTKQNAIELSMNSHDEAVHALRTGNFSFFLDNAPEVENHIRMTDRMGGTVALPYYLDVLDHIRKSAMTENAKLTRDQLRTLMYYVTGLANESPTAFTKWAAHKGLKIKAIDMQGKTARGVDELKWKITDEDLKKLAEMQSKKIKTLEEFRSFNRSGPQPSGNANHQDQSD